MSKKQVMKEIFEEKINQDRIYQKVLLKVEEEAGMNRIRNKKMIYGILSSCAMFIICATFIANGKFGIGDKGNSITEINDKYATIEDLKKEKDKQSTEININKIEEVKVAKIDAEIKAVSNFYNMPYYEAISNPTIPKDFDDKEYINAVYIKSDRSKKEYDKLLNYQHIYKNSNNNRIITIGFSEENKPMRDYHFEEEKTSKINDFEVVIYQYENSYITSFTYDKLNIDIETNDITQDELIALLQSIIKEKSDKVIEDKDTNVKEQPNESIGTNYPDYYAGKYIDNNGNNVILLCEDNKDNRKEICNKLGITESKTIFKTAKYSYNYLTELQNKISKKMIDKEFTFVTTSAVMEDNNNIKVTVISNKESDLNKIKSLDTIGGAIDIEYNTNSRATKDLLVEKK